MKRTNKYIITSMVECGVRFTTIQSAMSYAKEHNLKVCEVYYQDGNSKIFLGYSVENEDGLAKPVASVWTVSKWKMDLDLNFPNGFE